MTILIIVLFILNLLNISHSISDFACIELNDPIEDRIDCPSFDIIAQNTHDSSISIFCRILMHHWCMYNFSSDQELNDMWKSFACRTPVRMFSTIGEMGIWVRSRMNSIFDTYCEVKITVGPGGVQILQIQKKVI